MQRQHFLKIEVTHSMLTKLEHNNSKDKIYSDWIILRLRLTLSAVTLMTTKRDTTCFETD